MKTLNKFVAVLLCLQFTSVQTVFAQVNAQPQKVTQQEVARKISATDQYRIVSIVALAGWATAACALTIMIKNGVKRIQRTPKQQLDLIFKDIMEGVETNTLAPYKVSEAKRFMQESAPALQKIEDHGYIYKHYKMLPSFDNELPQFWEKSYTKNGGKIPASLNEYRSILAKFQMDFNRELYVTSTKRSKAMTSLIININEKFYAFEALEGSSSEEAQKLLSSIDTDVKKLTAIAAKERPAVQEAVGTLTRQLNKEIEFKNFRDALNVMQLQAEKAYSAHGAQYAEQIANLSAQINNNFRNLAATQNTTEKRKFSAAIERDSKVLTELAVKSESKGIKEAATEFLTRVSREVRGKGGMMGVGAVLVAGTALLLISGNSQAATVSNKRVLAQRELAFSFKNTPDMFLVTVLSSKEKYGIETVSSIIAENQSLYYPLFESQLAVMLNPKAKECLKKFMLAHNTTAEQNKASLVKQLKY